MDNFVELMGGYNVSDGFETDDGASVQFPTLGPFGDGDIKRGHLSALQCSEVFNLQGRYSALFLGLTGNAILKFDYNAGTATLDQELRFCNLPDCPQQGGLTYIIPLPVCDWEHAQVCAAPGCGIEYKFGYFGQPAPVVL